MKQSRNALLPAAALVNLERYAIDGLDTDRSRALIEDCREQMHAMGCCRLPGFLSASGLGAIRQEARAVVDYAHHSDRQLTPYYREPDPELPSTDPRASPVRFAVGYVARDRLPSEGYIHSLFAWDVLLTLVGAILNRVPIHRFDDTLGSLNVTVMRSGQELGWHFDACEAVASVLLEEAVQGGTFQYIPPFLGSQIQRREQVSAVLDGDQSDALEVAMEPGDFLLICGRHSLHRVTKIVDGGPRLMLLMSYDTVEHRQSDNLSNANLFGRASAKSPASIESKHRTHRE